MAIDYPRTYFGWSETSPADYADPDDGLVIHYNGDATHLDSHAECVSYWKGVRDSHVNGRGWTDGGYSFGVDVEGSIFEMRGLHRYQAAQGTTHGNANYYSVSLMIGGSEQPTAAQIEGVRRLRAWLMDEHGVAGTVLGHRDFLSTSCPGAPLYALVQDGTFTQPPGAPTTITEDTMAYFDLQVGDTGERVKLLQLRTRRAGFGAALGETGADGIYGPGTAEAVRLCREYVGSRALEGYGDKMTAHAVDQVEAAVTKRALEKLVTDTGTSSAPALPATASISGTVTLEA